MTASEIIQIILGILSLFATIAVSFFIYWLQSRHEKEIQDLEERREQKELAEKAHVFLSENSDERDYLPWCIIAANQHRHEKHTRRIYTNYYRCSEDLQTEILKQAGFTIAPIKGQEWVDICFKCVEEDVKKYKLGRNYLYDGAKYFHRGFERYRRQRYALSDTRATTVSYNKSFTQAKFHNTTVEFNRYFDDYWAVMEGELDIKELEDGKPIPPMDLIWEAQGLGVAEEQVVCYWIMDCVEEIVVNKYNRTEGLQGVVFENMTDADAATYEDKYYEIMLWLYYTYYEPTIRMQTQQKLENKKQSNSKSRQKKEKSGKIKTVEEDICHSPKKTTKTQ